MMFLVCDLLCCCLGLARAVARNVTRDEGYFVLHFVLSDWLDLYFVFSLVVCCHSLTWPTRDLLLVP